MLDVKEIGKLIGEEIKNEPAPGFYPGSFRPPTKGHFNAAYDIASKPYIQNLTIVIGKGDKYSINAIQSKKIWDIYLKAQPNPKIKVILSPDKSPIDYIFKYLGSDLKRQAYIVQTQNEEDDQKYINSLQNAFANRVKPVVAKEKFTDEDGEPTTSASVSGTITQLKKSYNEFQNTKDRKYLNDYNNSYNYLKTLFPDVVIQKGYFDEIQKILGINFPKPESLQEIKTEDNNYNKEKNWVWLEYRNKKQLNPVIFENDVMNPEVKELLLKIATHFWDKLELAQPYDDVTLTGSSANYNYTSNSDVDLHIIVDFNKFSNPGLIKKYFDSVVSNWNMKHDLKLGTNPIQIYVQDSNEKHTSTGVYSVMEDKWIKKPTYEEINIPDGNIKKKSKVFKEKINQLVKLGTKDKERSLELINKIQEKLKNFRQEGLDKNGEYSLENLAFKDLRNTGYLEKLSTLKTQLLDKDLSLNENTEVIKPIIDSFLEFAKDELQLNKVPSVEIKSLKEEPQPSFGAYSPSTNQIFLDTSNRHVVDVLRTLAHELVHAKQNELGLIGPDSGNTGSDIENDANSIAGIIIRDYGKQNPSIYKL
jgi:hypothetical protein